MAMGKGDSLLDPRMSSEQAKAMGHAAANGMSVSQRALDLPLMSVRSDQPDASTLRMSARAFDEFARALEEPRPEELEEFLRQRTIWEG